MHPYTDVLITRGAHIADWLLTQIDGEGSLLHATDMYAYTKCVYALSLAGHPDRAALVLNQILKRFGTADGDLMLDEQAGKKTWEPYTSFFSQTYSNSWVILGAEKLGRQETVRKLNQCLLDYFYDPEMGAMRSSRKPVKDRYDTCSAATGILCLLNSRFDVAEKLGEFLMKVERGQPDRENIFYCNIEKPFRYATEFHPRFPAFTGVKTGAPGQAVWMIGYPIAALAKLYEYTGKTSYLDGAKKYADAFMHAGEHACVSAGCGKALWGFSILYRLTGDARYDQVCRRILDHYFTQQAPDGSFPIPGFVPEEDMKGYSVIFDTTPEYCRWFFEVAAELNGGQ
jgi:hypothetical protein